MPRLAHPARWLALVVIVIAPFIPDVQPPVERDPELDIELVRAAEVRYRGITGTFEELTRAYALTAYTDAEMLGWTTRPSLQYPETETLVTCRFRVSGTRQDAETNDEVRNLRDRVDEELLVTWRLGTLSSVQVTPGDDYARDAINTLRHTIDDYLSSMVLLIEDLPLCSAAAADDTVGFAHQGEILLRQMQQEGWSQVRVPADSVMGWLPDSVLTDVSPQ